MSAVTYLVQEMGEPTADEVRERVIAEFPEFKGKDEVGARLADVWRITGAVMQTGLSRKSTFSKKFGKTWRYVPVERRAEAIATYWEKRKADIKKTIAKLYEGIPEEFREDLGIGSSVSPSTSVGA
jgi:hypothetical protein